MADEKNPFQRDASDFLKTAITGAPLAAGVGIGIRNMVREGVSQPKPTSVSRAMATLDKLRGSRPWEAAIEEHLSFIRGEQHYLRGTGALAAQEAWTRAVAAADPMAREHMLTFAKNIEALPPEQVYSAIENTMNRQRSEMAESIYRRFTRNLLALREQEAIVGKPAIYEKAAGVFGKPSFKRLPAELQAVIASIEETLGIEPGATRKAWFEHPVLKAEELGTYKLTFPTTAGDVSMMVPVAKEGVLVSGATQQTRYIAPDVWVWDIEAKEMQKMKRHEFLMREFERTIVPKLKAGKMDLKEAEKAVTQLQQRVVHQLETVVNVPAELRTGSQMAYEDMRKTAVDIFIREEEKIRKATENELIEIARREGLYGGTSPTAMAKGRLQTQDLARLYMTPEAAETAKRLEQGIRKYELTEQARSKMMDLERYKRYRQYESAAMRQFEPVLRRPNVRTLYVDPSMLAGLRIGEGEVMAREGLRELFVFQANQAQRLVNMRADIKAALLEGKEVTPAVGEIIGWTEAQEPFRMQQGMKLLRAVEHRNRSLGDFFTLHYMDIQRLQSNDKFFEDMKALMRLKGEDGFRSAALRLARSGDIAEGVDVIASMDYLKKDPRKLEQQIISSLGEVLVRRPMTPPGAVRTYAEGGAETIVNIWRKMAMTKPDVYEHKKFVQEAMRFAIKEADLRPTEFREVFGALAYALPGKATEATQMLREVSKGLSEEVIAGYLKAWEGPATAAGIAKIAYAEPAWITGAGAMGSIEPRVLDVLRGPAWGEFGAALEEDFIRRLEYTTPERLAVHREVTKTLESMAGKVTPPPGARDWKAAGGYAYESFDEFIEKGGGWMRPGKGMKPIYVPGAPTLKAMREFQIGDITIRGQLADTYHEIAKSAASMHDEMSRITPAEFLRELERSRPGPMGEGRGRSLIGTLAYHWAPGGKGMGRVTGGKMIGSRFLRGVSEAGGWAARRGVADPFVVGLPTRQFEEMFEEMTRSKLYQNRAEALNRMRTAFMEGEEIGGAVLRHPIIGEFSVQPVRFQRIEPKDMPKEKWMRRAELVIPEEQVTIGIKESPGPKKITIGPLVGLAGDKDADIYSAILLQPDDAKQARQMTMAADSEFARRYTQHQVRYQLLKPGAAEEAAELTMTAKRMADIRKLGTTQRWVPLLSTELSRARRALLAEGGVGAANAWTMLEWLEQHLISAKHLSAQQMEKGGLEAMLMQTTSALNSRTAEAQTRMKTVVQQIVQNDQTAGQLLTGNVTLTDDSVKTLSAVMGRKIERQISGVDIDATIKNLFSAMDRFESSGGAHWADLQMARGRVKLSEIGQMVAESAATITRTSTGVFSRVTEAAMTAKNIAGRLGAGVIRNYKPLGLGIAGAMAIGAVLSSPPETVGSGAGMRNVKVNMNMGKAKGRMKPETMMPPQQDIGSPTAPNMLSSSEVPITPPRKSRQTYIKARANYMVNAPNLAGQIAGLAGRRPVNVNLRDNRMSLNPHVIANKLV